MASNYDLTITRRYNGNTPCPVCHAGSKNCSLTDDGAQLCRGEPANPSAWAMLKRAGNGFGIYRPAETSDPKPVCRKPAA